MSIDAVLSRAAFIWDPVLIKRKFIPEKKPNRGRGLTIWNFQKYSRNSKWSFQTFANISFLGFRCYILKISERCNTTEVQKSMPSITHPSSHLTPSCLFFLWNSPLISFQSIIWLLFSWLWDTSGQSNVATSLPNFD